MPKFQQRLRSVIHRIKRNGWIGLLKLLKYNLYHTSTSIRMVNNLEGGIEQQYNEELKIERGHLDILDEWREGPGIRETNSAFNIDRIYGLNYFYLGCAKENLAQIAWVLTHRDHNPRIDLQTGEVEIFSMFTLPGYRARGLSTLCVRVILHDLARDNFCRVYAHIDQDNKPSLRVFENCSFKPICQVKHKRVLGFDRRTLDYLSVF